jgi:PKD repeat protein
MKKNLFTLLGLFMIMGSSNLHAQDEPQYPEMIATAIAHKVIGPVSDFPALTAEELAEMAKEDAKVKRNEELKVRNYPFYEQYKLDGPDRAWQSAMGETRSAKGIIQNWNAQTTWSNPPDDNGAAGPNHYMQTINVNYTIYDKSGTLLEGPTPLNVFFQGLPGGSNNDGDPIILYDELAQRWLMAEFSGAWSNPDYMLIAVSQTDDPTGSWDAWSFTMNGFPDYMKFGVWRDGYYMGTNTYTGSDIYVFERDEMLAGGTSPKMVQFNNPYRPNSGFHCVLPVDNDGDYAPIGTPGMFATINDNAWGGSSNDQIWLYELDVDWNNTSNSTFNRVQQIDVESFDSNFGTTWDNISQPGTGQKLDAINQITMHRNVYRNFGTSQNILLNHTVDVDATNHAGIRWYELEHNGTDWEVRQYGTYAPDGDSRWMGSISMNGAREIALGYSVSSSSTYPSIRYAGQSIAEYNTASGILDIAEESIHEGTASQTSSNRWGDYSAMCVDPEDDHTFWYTNQYNVNGNMKATKIASFEFSSNVLSADFVADNLTPTTEDTVYFTDLSLGQPDSWAWTFTPSTVTFLSFTNSNAQNPVVRFNDPGLYTIELIVSDQNTSDTITKVDYIDASPASGMTVVATATPGEVCAGEMVQLNTFPTGGGGSYTYSWSSDPEGFSSTLADPVDYPEESTTYYVEVVSGTDTAYADTYVTVNPLPEITLGDWPDYLCNVDVPPIQLTALPEGGTYSGTGINNSGIFISSTANIGWNVITYTYEDPDGCENSAQDSIYVDDCVGLDEWVADEESVNIYPNPARGAFTLESEETIEKIEIIDQSGKMVMMRKINDKSTWISALRAKGFYFVRVYIENQNAAPEVITKEFIIK